MEKAPQKLWLIVGAVSVLQVPIAGYSRIVSGHDPLSEVACLGGFFGGFANLVIGGGVVLWLLGLVVISLRRKATHPWIAPLLMLGLSSGLALLLAMQAALRCTV